MMPESKLHFRPAGLVFLAVMLALTIALARPAQAQAQGQDQGNVNLTFDVSSTGDPIPGTSGQPGESLAPAQPGSLPMFDPQNPVSAQPLGDPGIPGEAYSPPPSPTGSTDFNQLGAPPELPVDMSPDQGEFTTLDLPATLPAPTTGLSPLVQLPDNEEEPSGEGGPTPEELAKKEEQTKIYSELENWHSQILANYVFNPTLLADPFLPIESALPAAANPTRDSADRNKPPIQKLALSQFTLSAIIVASDPRENSANVDSGGRGFIIKKGTLIGPNDGYVKEITENTVVIEEPEVNFRGETSYKETVLRLNQFDTESVGYFEELE